MAHAGHSDILFKENQPGSRRTVFISLSDEGLTLEAVDSGPGPEAHFGRDYEFGIRIAPADLPRLAYELIMAHYRDRFSAVDEVKAIAGQAGIKTHFSNW
jgi:hypothetical protein